MRMFRLLPLALTACLAGPLALAQQPPAKGPTPEEKAKAKAERQKDRVFVKDIEGVWLPRDYMDALRITRQPHVAARKAAPILIKIQKDGPIYPIMRTDFSKAVLQQVLDIEPDGKPGSYRLAVADDTTRPVPHDEVTYIPFRGTKGVEGRLTSLSMAEPNFGKRRYRDFLLLSEGLAVFVNRAVLAGKYSDQQGHAYVFGEAGDASFPEGKFDYEVSLVADGAACDYLETPDDKAPGGRKRYGFGWKSGKLQLFNTTGAEPRNVRCDQKPFAVLTPQT